MYRDSSLSKQEINQANDTVVCEVRRVNHDGPGVENFHLLYDVSTQLGLPQVWYKMSTCQQFIVTERQNTVLVV